MKTSQSMLYWEIIAVFFSEIRKNTLIHCVGRMLNFLMLNLMVYKATGRF
jgi:hypothetical protein